MHSEYTTESVNIAASLKMLLSRVKTIWKARQKAYGAVITSIVISSLVGFCSSPEYTSRTVVVPYKSGSSGLSGLAGIAGIRLPNASLDQTITADIYPQIVASLDFQVAIAETPLYFQTIGDELTSAEYFRLHQKTPLLGTLLYTASRAPAKILSYFETRRGKVDSSFSKKSTTSSIKKYNAEYLGLVNELQQRIKVSFDKKTNILTIVCKMPDAYAAAELTQITSDNLQKRLINFETQKATDQLTFVDEQFRIARTRYEQAQYKYARYADRNRGLTEQTAKIRGDQLERELDLAYEVYQQLGRELEQARIRTNQETPVFATVESVSVPIERSSPRRLRILLVGIALGIAIGVSRILFQQSIFETV